MQYQVGSFSICTLEGVARSCGQDFKIRPKTMQVLQYLIERRDRVVTKREILDAIWDDVVVQDQVLFQSIKELRDLFAELMVIKTFPRKGYQWVADVVDEAAVDAEAEIVANTQVRESKARASRRNWFAGGAVLLALLFLNVFFFYGSAGNKGAAPLDIAVLPVVDEMDDRDHQWVRLAGMDILIHQLQQATTLHVIETDDILYGLERSDAYAELTLDEQVYRVRQSTGADVIVQTQLRGYPQDYQLHYSLISPHSTERGVEFSDTIEGLMQALTETIAARFGVISGEVLAYKSDFSNEAFASGVEHYMLEEFSVAEPFLRAAVTANPELLAARRFLAGALAHDEELDEAIALLADNVVRAKATSNRREEVRATLMIGNLLANDGRSAEAGEYLVSAKGLAESYGDELFIAYAYEELGSIHRRAGDFDEAERLLKVALGYQGSFSCPYGQTNVLVELGSNAFARGDRDAAQRYLDRALAIAEESGVAVSQFWTLLALADMHSANGDLSRSNALALRAKNLADQVHDDYLLNKANHWLNQAGGGRIQ